MATKKSKTEVAEKTEKVVKTPKAKVAKVAKKVEAAKTPKKAAKTVVKTVEVKETEKIAPKKAKTAVKAGPKKAQAKEDAETSAKEAAIELAKAEAGAEAEEAVVEKKVKASRVRGAKYLAVRSKIDKTKIYEPAAAVELVKKLSFTKFKGSLEVHMIVREIGQNITVTLPHSTGKKIRVAICSDEVLAEVEKGVINFDVLVSTAQYMPKLAKFARVLGPKGLMPNPKAGTLTDKPEVKKAELEGGKTILKTEKKAPLIHTTIGSIAMETKDLVENLAALLKAGGGRITKMSICSTMSPGVRVLVEA